MDDAPAPQREATVLRDRGDSMCSRSAPSQRGALPYWQGSYQALVVFHRRLLSGTMVMSEKRL